jgi:GxxExxY protein
MEEKRLREPDEELNPLAGEAIGAAIEVHKALGPGLLESVYEEALAIELELRGVPFKRQPDVDLRYKDRLVGKGRLDFLVWSRLVVELKAAEVISEAHVAQVLSYLRATGLLLGLIINSNVYRLTAGIKRVISS